MEIQEDIYRKNLAVVGKRDPSLAQLLEQLEVPPSYRVEPSRDGDPTLIITTPEGKQKVIHSKYSPQEEASRLISSLDLASEVNLILLGLGLGYHIDHLNRHGVGEYNLYLVEPDPALFKCAISARDLSPFLESPRTTLLVGLSPEDTCKRLESYLNYFVFNGVRAVPLPSLDSIQRPFWDAILSPILKLHQLLAFNARTRAGQMPLVYENMFGNLRSVLSSPGIIPYHQFFHGIPAIIISAGPSLDKNISLLSRAKGKSLLIAVGTALKPLLQKGIEPDFVAAIDPHAASIEAFPQDFTNLNTTLVFDPQIPPQICGLFAGKGITFLNDTHLCQWLVQVQEDKGTLGLHHTVAHTAFSLACWMGCNPVVFIGQDLSYPYLRSHASGSFHEDLNKELTPSDADQWTEDIFGGKVKTSPSFLRYLHLLEEQIAATGALCINATEGGTKIKGTEIMSLKEVLYRYCQNPLPEKEGMDPLSSRDIPLERIQGKLNDKLSYLEAHRTRIEELLNDIDVEKKEEKKIEIIIRETEDILKSLLQEEEAFKWLEEVNQSELFSRYKINTLLEMGKIEEEEIGKTLYERDTKFLTTILDAIRFLQENIRKALDDLNNPQ